MASSPAFKMKLVGDVRDATRSLDKMEKRSKKFGAGMIKMAGAMVAAFAVQKIISGVSDAVKRAEEMNSLYAATETIVKNMGDVTGKTAQEIKDMNTAMSLSTGIDKAAITESTNILLTFGNIGGEAFEQASEMALDMSTIFGGTAASNAKVLGKALNDPIKGLSALSRVGVQFTDEQKKMITAMQESGDIAGAQAIIMEELQSQVGGTAVATADATAKLSNMGKEAQEWVGNKILPLIEKLADFMVDSVIPAFRKVADWIRENVPPWYNEHIKPTMDKIMEVVRFVMEWVSTFWKEKGEAITAFVMEWVGIIWGFYSAYAGLIIDVFKVMWGIVSELWDKYGDKITKVVQAWWGVIGPTIKLIADVIGKLIKTVTALFRGDWATAWEEMQGIVEAVVEYMKEVPGKIVEYLKSAIGLAGSVAVDIGRAIVNGIIGMWNKLDPRITLPTLDIFGKKFGGQTSPDLLPDLPYLASGGIVRGPTLAMIGEAGAEAVVPLDRGYGGDIVINFNGVVGNPVEAGRMVQDVLTEYALATGVR